MAKLSANHYNSMPLDALLKIRVQRKLLEHLERLAERENLNVANLVRHILTKAVGWSPGTSYDATVEGQEAKQPAPGQINSEARALVESVGPAVMGLASSEQTPEDQKQSAQTLQPPKGVARQKPEKKTSKTRGSR